MHAAAICQRHDHAATGFTHSLLTFQTLLQELFLSTRQAVSAKGRAPAWAARGRGRRGGAQEPKPPEGRSRQQRMAQMSIAASRLVLWPTCTASPAKVGADSLPTCPRLGAWECPWSCPEGGHGTTPCIETNPTNCPSSSSALHIPSRVGTG